MVEVVGLGEALPKPGSEHAPEGLAKAARPGRTRDAALTLYAAALANPRGADGVLRHGLREARHLHSRERRLVADGVNDLLRHRRVLERVAGAPEAQWDALLALYGGADPIAPIRAEIEGMEPIAATTLAGSLDEAVAEALHATWGAATGMWLAASNVRPPTVLRAQGDRGALMADLVEEGVATRSGEWSASALVVEGRANVEGTAAFRAGRFEVQDEGSQLVAEAVDARGIVVDFCAGAGGKTLALAQAGVERIIACDVRAAALDELMRRARRAGVRPEPVLLGEGLPAALRGVRADRVLVDAPCSGTGVLRRHPAYRLRLDGAELARLVAAQGRILARAAPLVRPGGWLVYATCSALRVENDGVVEAFLERNPEFRPLPLGQRWGPRARVLGGDALRLSPHQHGTDGFFAALLQRTA